MCPRASRPPISLVAAMRTIGLAAVALTLADCGQWQHSPRRATSTNYTVGGTISGLTVSSVVLANGTATVTHPGGRDLLGVSDFLCRWQQLLGDGEDATHRRAV